MMIGNSLLAKLVWCFIYFSFIIAFFASDITTAGSDIMNSALNISVWFPSMIGRSKLAYVLVPDYYLRNDRFLIKHCKSSQCTWTLSEPLLQQIQAVASLVVNQRSPMINCNSGIGLFMLGVWHYTSGAAQSHVVNIVSTQPVTPLTEVMTANVVANGYWAQSLLISSNTCELFQRSRAVPLFFSETALQEIVADVVPSAGQTFSISFLVEQMIEGVCPALIHISSYPSLSDWSVLIYLVGLCVEVLSMTSLRQVVVLSAGRSGSAVSLRLAGLPGDGDSAVLPAS